MMPHRVCRHSSSVASGAAEMQPKHLRRSSSFRTLADPFVTSSSAAAAAARQTRMSFSSYSAGAFSRTFNSDVTVATTEVGMGVGAHESESGAGESKVRRNNSNSNGTAASGSNIEGHHQENNNNNNNNNNNKHRLTIANTDSGVVMMDSVCSRLLRSDSGSVGSGNSSASANDEDHDTPREPLPASRNGTRASRLRKRRGSPAGPLNFCMAEADTCNTDAQDVAEAYNRQEEVCFYPLQSQNNILGLLRMDDDSSNNNISHYTFRRRRTVAIGSASANGTNDITGAAHARALLSGPSFSSTGAVAVAAAADAAADEAEPALCDSTELPPSVLRHLTRAAASEGSSEDEYTLMEQPQSPGLEVDGYLLMAAAPLPGPVGRPLAPPAPPSFTPLQQQQQPQQPLGSWDAVPCCLGQPSDAGSIGLAADDGFSLSPFVARRLSTQYQSMQQQQQQWSVSVNAAGVASPPPPRSSCLGVAICGSACAPPPPPSFSSSLVAAAPEARRRPSSAFAPFTPLVSPLFAAAAAASSSTAVSTTSTSASSSSGAAQSPRGKTAAARMPPWCRHLANVTVAGAGENSGGVGGALLIHVPAQPPLRHPSPARGPCSGDGGAAPTAASVPPAAHTHDDFSLSRSASAGDVLTGVLPPDAAQGSREEAPALSSGGEGEGKEEDCMSAVRAPLPPGTRKHSAATTPLCASLLRMVHDDDDSTTDGSGSGVTGGSHFYNDTNSDSGSLGAVSGAAAPPAPAANAGRLLLVAATRPCTPLNLALPAQPSPGAATSAAHPASPASPNSTAQYPRSPRRAFLAGTSAPGSPTGETSHAGTPPPPTPVGSPLVLLQRPPPPRDAAALAAYRSGLRAASLSVSSSFTVAGAGGGAGSQQNHKMAAVGPLSPSRLAPLSPPAAIAEATKPLLPPTEKVSPTVATPSPLRAPPCPARRQLFQQSEPLTPGACAAGTRPRGNPLHWLSTPASPERRGHVVSGGSAHMESLRDSESLSASIAAAACERFPNTNISGGRRACSLPTSQHASPYARSVAVPAIAGTLVGGIHTGNTYTNAGPVCSLQVVRNNNGTISNPGNHADNHYNNDDNNDEAWLPLSPLLERRGPPPHAVVHASTPPARRKHHRAHAGEGDVGARGTAIAQRQQQNDPQRQHNDEEDDTSQQQQQKQRGAEGKKTGNLPFLDRVSPAALYWG